jgi:CoA:oxalate CoA-transferase
MLSFPTDDALFATLDEHRLPAAPVMSMVDTLNHPYFKARQTVRTVPDPMLGEVTIPGFPLKFSAYPNLPDIVAPLLGEHSAEILRDHLGYSDAQIAKLQSDSVLYRENR